MIYIPLRKILKAIVIAVAVFTVSTILPMENFLFRFPHLKPLYGYNQSGEAKLTVEGKDSALVIGEKSDTFENIIIPKRSDGWKFSMGYKTIICSYSLTNGYAVYIYPHSDIADYYIIIASTKSGECEISDSLNSKFVHLTDKSGDYYTYYAYISQFNEQYKITVNGASFLSTTDKANMQKPGIANRVRLCYYVNSGCGNTRKGVLLC